MSLPNLPSTRSSRAVCAQNRCGGAVAHRPDRGISGRFRRSGRSPRPRCAQFPRVFGQLGDSAHRSECPALAHEGSPEKAARAPPQRGRARSLLAARRMRWPPNERFIHPPGGLLLPVASWPLAVIGSSTGPSSRGAPPSRLAMKLVSGPRSTAGCARGWKRQGFVEIETPMLIASTPEGARDFVVPSRLRPGEFYALPQSPQLFKQLLMVGGFDRYYQIARCLRDEDLRADRQFEFMQLDVEMSFAEPGGRARGRSRPRCSPRPRRSPARPGPPIARMTWHDAMERYGTDKPDLRFGMELVELDEVFAATEFRAFAGAEAVKGIRVEGEGDAAAAAVDALVDRAKELGAAGLVWMRVARRRRRSSRRSRSSSPRPSSSASSTRSGAEPGDLVLIVAGDAAPTNAGARPAAPRPRSSAGGRGRLALPVGRRLPAVRGARRRRSPDPGAPRVHDAAPRRPRPARDRTRSSVRSQAYDLVLNGWELGSGSVRIHRPDIQQRIFALLGIDEERGAGAVRLPARRVPLRRAAARRVRVRHRPARRDARRRGEHPRGDRVPEDAVGHRPAHRRAPADRPDAAPRARPAAPSRPKPAPS